MTDPAATREKGCPLEASLRDTRDFVSIKRKEGTSPGDPNPAESGIQKLGHSGLQGLGVPRIQSVCSPYGHLARVPPSGTMVSPPTTVTLDALPPTQKSLETLSRLQIKVASRSCWKQPEAS